ncbi:MAG: cyclic nucleotide-binding domain-containing protein [Candidatus Riflebacteria bacterium]|nr:cyclic nucleotide-binding domain-containing protein [Candidatus Riflebacteria bacterium]
MLIHAFARTHICRYLNEQEAQVLLDQGTLRRLPQGEILFKTGDPGDSMFVILQGRVHIYQVLEGGIVKTLANLGYGAIIGEVSVIDRQPRSAAASALEDSALFELSRTQIVGLIRNQAALAAKVLWAVMETISVRLRDTNASVQSLLLEKLRELPRDDL